MKQMDRIYKIDTLLANGRSRSLQFLLDELEISRATFKRDIAFMKDRFNAPITWDRETRGYRMASHGGTGPSYELPGLWFNQRELLALATMQQLLSSMDKGGPIASQLQPLMDRINVKLGHEKEEARELSKRVKLISTTSRLNDLAHFEVIGTALVKRIRLDIEYEARGSSQSASQRVVSPQRLIHYRSNWYLGAWCHSSRGIRTFSLDAIVSCVVVEKPRAKDIPDRELLNTTKQGTGFSGERSASGRNSGLMLVPHAMSKRRSGIRNNAQALMAVGTMSLRCLMCIPMSSSWMYYAMGRMWKCWSRNLFGWKCSAELKAWFEYMLTRLVSRRWRDRTVLFLLLWNFVAEPNLSFSAIVFLTVSIVIPISDNGLPENSLNQLFL